MPKVVRFLLMQKQLNPALDLLQQSHYVITDMLHEI
jgi:hypothetical protein